MKDKLKVAVVQCASLPTISQNRPLISKLCKELHSGLDLVVFPENIFTLADDETIRQEAKPVTKWLEIFQTLELKKSQAWSFGVPTLSDGNIYNSILVIDNHGKLITNYNKIHLFQLNQPDLPVIDETTLYTQGKEAICFELSGWKIFLSICYDLRFPELYRANLPFDIIICSAAFTAKTGEDHWQLLCQTRGMENQAYLLAANQSGHNKKTEVHCFGQSMIVDPWGKIDAIAKQDNEIIYSQLTVERLQEVRQILPALKNRCL